MLRCVVRYRSVSGVIDPTVPIHDDPCGPRVIPAQLARRGRVVGLVRGVTGAPSRREQHARTWEEASGDFGMRQQARDSKARQRCRGFSLAWCQIVPGKLTVGWCRSFCLASGNWAVASCPAVCLRVRRKRSITVGGRVLKKVTPHSQNGMAYDPPCHTEDDRDLFRHKLLCLAN